MSTRLRRTAVRGLVIAATSILVLVGLTATPAQAAYTGISWFKPSGQAGGFADTRSSGENLNVIDYFGDGLGTRAQLQTLEWSSSGYQYWANHGGVCFDDTSTSGETICNRNVAEGKTFRIHIWASQSGTTAYHNYSDPITA
ncbi:hypothetical protein [Glycomyces tenuis]|uniref:hypothetical protein n=1 Tax=Glycomyces tenuis TaxID=58116 RepID=UPI0004135442|nr:hypothetical protein [Glycomyces tenuis]